MSFPSKLLLFGEYLLLLGARALAIPVAAFAGEWASGGTGLPGDRREQLLKFANSLALKSVPGLDYKAFRRDISEGLYFRSDIPVGYGLGSSGALCAAVYERYATEKTAALAELKALFAQMENHFHGQSSGIDPLTSYLNRPLLIANRDEVAFFEAAPWPSRPPTVFLLDSGQPRRTGPLVQWFLEKKTETTFSNGLHQTLLPASEALINAWQTADEAAFWPALRRVSAFQLENMPPMIPEHLRPVWEKNLRDGHIVFKICGAGGGGFVLGFAPSRQIALDGLPDFTVVFPFEKNDVVEK
ncbi:MAG: hypothetical protein ABMA02_15885 [Saprospiraceae bacterium]